MARILALILTLPLAGLGQDLEEWTSIFGFDGDLHQITRAGGWWVVLGESPSRLYASHDRRRWKEHTVPSGLNDITWGHDRFVAVGQGGLVVTFAPGDSPLVQASGITEDLNAITYAAGQFWTVGSGGLVHTSDDGVAWTPESIADPSITFHDIQAYDRDIVAVGSALSVYSRWLVNPLSQWTERYSGDPGLDLFQVKSLSFFSWVGLGSGLRVSGNSSWHERHAYGLPDTVDDLANCGPFALAAAEGVLYQSAESHAWVPVALPGDPYVRAIESVGSMVLVVGDDGAFLHTDEADTFGWDVRDAGMTSDFRSIVRCGDTWIGLAADDDLYRSLDGIKWTRMDPGKSDLNDLAFDGVSLIIVGDAGQVLTSTDGVSWFVPTTPTSNDLYSVSSVGDDLIACGYKGTVLRSQDGGQSWSLEAFPSTSHLYVSADYGTGAVGGQNGRVWIHNGASWDPVNPVTSAVITGLDGLAGELVATTDLGDLLKLSFLGTWDTVAAAGVALNDVAFHPSVGFVAVGAQGRIMRSPKGNSWETDPHPYTTDLVCVGTDGQTFLALGRAGGVMAQVPKVSDRTWWLGSFSDQPGLMKAVVNVEHRLIGIDTNGHITGFSRGRNSFGHFPPGGLTDPRGVATLNGLLITVSGSMSATQSLHSSDPWAQTSSFPGDDMNDVAANDAVCVAVGQQGAIFSSGDGLSWTLRNSTTSQDLGSVMWDGVLFHAFGANGVRVMSADGITWSDGSIPTAEDVLAMAFSDDRQMVALTNGELALKVDGGGWQFVTLPILSDPVGVEWTGVQFVILSETGEVCVSQDGISWEVLMQVQGTFCGLGSDGVYLYAFGQDPSDIPDALLIQAHQIVDPIEGTGPFLLDLVGGKSTYVGIAYGYVYQGPNLNELTFSAVLSDTPRAIAFNGAQFVVVGDNGYGVVSQDGEQWDAMDTGVSQDLLDILVWHDDLYVVGQDGVLLRSSNGTDWDPLASGTIHSLRALLANPNMLVAVGDADTVITSSNGVVWTPRTSPVMTDFTCGTWNGESFVAFGEMGGIISDDGVTWDALDYDADGLPTDVVASPDFGVLGNEFRAVVGPLDDLGMTAQQNPAALIQVGNEVHGFDGVGHATWRAGQTQHDLPFSTYLPSQQRRCLGSRLTLGLEVDVSESVYYFWEKDDQPLEGEHDSELIIDPFTPDDVGWYRCYATTGLTLGTFSWYLEVEQLYGGIERTVYAQGLNPLDIEANLTCDNDVLSFEWVELDQMTILDVDVNPLSMAFTQTTPVGMTAMNDYGQEVMYETLVLVSQNPLHFDYNGDGCNNALDIQAYAAHWHEDDGDDADGDDSVTVLDFVYFNTDDPVPCQ